MCKLRACVCIHGFSTGSKYEHKVIMIVSPYILQCTCTSQLLPYLVKRKVLNDQSSAHILSQPESEAGKNLNKVLMGIAHEPDNQDTIENIYLALFDCYEETGIEWCWDMAAKTLRSTGNHSPKHYHSGNFIYILILIFLCSDIRIETT